MPMKMWVTHLRRKHLERDIGVKGEGWNTIKDEVIKLTMNRRSKTPEVGIERNLGTL